MQKDNIVYRAISFTDLNMCGYEIEVEIVHEGIEETDYRVVAVKKDGNKQSLDDFYKAVYFLGIKDNEYLHVEQVSEHRTMNGRLTNAHRICGQERNDKQWIKSGYASEEAILSSSKMKDMVHVGMHMQRGGA